MSELLKRFLTAIVAGGVAVTVIVLSPWGSWLFGLIVGFLGMDEFYRLTSVKSRVARWYMMGLGLAIWAYLLAFTLFPVSVSTYNLLLLGETNMLMIILALLAIPAIILLFEKQVTAAAQEMSSLVFGFFYAFLPMMLLYLLSLDPAAMAENFDFTAMEYDRSAAYDFRIPLGILILGWGLDTFAYFGGRFIGGRKLFERISPKKTWAGTIVGSIACVGLGFGFNWMWPVRLDWVVVALIVAPLAQLGDLVESMFKRGSQVKDSGGILPGHGGMLDRFDGMYLAIPAVYLYYIIVMATQFA